MDHWIDETEKVVVSDLERTVIDDLKQPEYYARFSEVATGFWKRRRILMEKAPIPNVGVLTKFEDTEGNVLGAMAYDHEPHT